MRIKLVLPQYSIVMYKIKVIHISFLTRLDVTEMIICKYSVLIWYQKRCPKEVDYCCTYQHTKGQDMENDQLRQLSKYHGLKLFVYLMGHMDFKNTNIRYPKKEKKER